MAARNGMLTHAPWTDLPGLRHGFGDRHDAFGSPVLLPRQVHGTRVVRMTAGGPRPEADAVVAAPGQLVGVVTADCVPVLLVDPRRRAAAAVHAGWRGAAAGVVEEALGRLRADGSEPADVEAAIGPAIGGCCYEIGAEVRDAFRARTGAVAVAAWEPHGDRWHLDLRTAIRALLAVAGVTRVTVLGPCTRCSADHHSYRRDGAAAGRQLSYVGWA